MKGTNLLFLLLLLNAHLFSQQLWNKQLPATSLRPYSDIRIENDRYRLAGGGDIFELDIYGTVSGYTQRPQAPVILGTNFVKPFPSSATKTFVFCNRNIQANSPAAYSLSLFKAGEGFSVGLTFPDSLGSNNAFGPACIDLNEQSFLIIGRKYVRKITLNPPGNLVVNWEKPLPLEQLNGACAAVLHGNTVFTATNQGTLLSLDIDGNVTGKKSHSLALRGLIDVNDGLVACGISNGNACLIKMDYNGNALWTQTYPDLEFNALTLNTDGSMAATGSAANGQILLTKVDPTGNVLWRQAYQSGTGSKVVPSPDGGYLLMASKGAAVYTLKTNALGETTVFDGIIAFRERNLKNEGVSVTQIPSSGLFFNGLESALHLPADSATSTVFVTTPWLAGVDAGANLYLSASTYGEPFSDYRTGIADNPVEEFNRVWSVRREEVEQLRRDYGDNGVLDSPPPFDILNWPAKGNPNFTQNLDFTAVSAQADSLPAPFVDANGDGLYNIYDGDYPALKGDRMLWWAITDQVYHNLSFGTPLTVDIFTTMYAYDCPQNAGVAQSIFVEYQVVNRRFSHYPVAYFGLHTDFDLGCDQDDNIGSIPEANTYYVYNEDATDGEPGNTCQAGISTYGNKIPVETVTMLDKKMNHAMYYSRSTGATGDATTPTEYYNYLQSIWRDGTPLTIGGSGYNPNNPGAAPTKFAFSGNPAFPQDWSMCSENLSQQDRRMIVSNGPFTFSFQDTFTMHLAFIYHPDIPHPCPDIQGLVKPAVLQIQEWYDQGTLDAHADLGSVQNLAPGQSLVLNAAQVDPSTQYAWSTGQHEPSIIINQIGEYSVTVTPVTGCAYTEKVLVKSASNTSSPAQPSWLLQPNPATDHVTITPFQSQSLVSVLLRNPQGQVVSQKNGTGDKLEMDISQFPSGMYWMEIWQDGACIGLRKLAIVR